jgi:hypothetical protein
MDRAVARGHRHRDELTRELGNPAHASEMPAAISISAADHELMQRRTDREAGCPDCIASSPASIGTRSRCGGSHDSGCPEERATVRRFDRLM